MTRMTNARIAGFTFLFYIAVGITGMVVSPGLGGGETATKLAIMAQHTAQVRIAMMLGFLAAFAALVLGVTLYGITRDEDRELAVLALACRVAEGVVVVVPMLATLGLLWLATSGASAPDAAGADALAAFLLKVKGWNTTIAATFFAVGSTIFTWLLLRGRMIPVALAWLGLVASVLLVVGLPLQLAGVLSGAITQIMWLPMAAFEIPLGLWLLIKGVQPARAIA